ncbi:hypothetical protein GCM10023333_42840 [Ferrimonas pelagia]|uniref:Uncharacterized protein n=1 Tax=Ferrimonas pelagia TaxID=1177826 RepID=A0ABP9FQ73_9GAMM
MPAAKLNPDTWTDAIKLAEALEACRTEEEQLLVAELLTPVPDTPTDTPSHELPGDQ